MSSAGEAIEKRRMSEPRCINLAAAFPEYRVRTSPDHSPGQRRDPWNLELFGRCGHVYPFGGEELCAFTDRRGIRHRLLRLPGVPGHGKSGMKRPSSASTSGTPALSSASSSRIAAGFSRRRDARSSGRLAGEGSSPPESPIGHGSYGFPALPGRKSVTARLGRTLVSGGRLVLRAPPGRRDLNPPSGDSFRSPCSRRHSEASAVRRISKGLKQCANKLLQSDRLRSD